MIPVAKQTTVYRAFGLTIASELALPELISAGKDAGQADVSIINADLTHMWRELRSEEFYTVMESAVYFHFPGIGLYEIRDGKQIAVSSYPNADPDVVRLYVLGTCMGTLLLQRGILPLHGSAVVIDGRAYAFVGESGAGKSTLAASLAHQGFPLLSDDMIAVSLDGEHSQPMVTPSFPSQKLWQESLSMLRMDHSQYAPLYRRLTKFSVPVHTRFHGESVPLSGIFELVATGSGNVECSRVNGLERLPLLYRHTYRNFLVPALSLEQWHFTVSSAIIGHTDFYRLNRPPGACILTHEVLNAIYERG